MNHPMRVMYDARMAFHSSRCSALMVIMKAHRLSMRKHVPSKRNSLWPALRTVWMVSNCCVIVVRACHDKVGLG